MAGEYEHARDIRAVLDQALGQWSAFDVDDVPEELPPIYAEISVTQRYGAPVRMSGARPVKGWRLVTRVVGTTVDEARKARDAIAGAVEDKRLLIAGTWTSPVRFETEDVIGDDDGRYSGATTWTYAH